MKLSLSALFGFLAVATMVNADEDQVSTRSPPLSHLPNLCHIRELSEADLSSLASCPFYLSMQNIRGLGYKRPNNLGECAYDCDRDRQCARGLLCADQHKAELRRAGLDERHAYCGCDIIVV